MAFAAPWADVHARLRESCVSEGRRQIYIIFSLSLPLSEQLRNRLCLYSEWG